MRTNLDPNGDSIARIKQGARWLWSQGDYPGLARLLEPEALALASRCVSAGLRVLDVAAGNGNFAIAAARRGARVTASDFAPRMIELGRERSSREGLDMTWLEADAESLPFPAAAFDVAASVFGAMFAPRPEMVTAEMFRVVRPGGKVAMANYGSEGYLGRLSALISRFSTASAVELPSPFLWGDATELRRRLQPHATAVEVESRVLRFEFASFEDWWAGFAQTNPPLMAMRQILPGPAFEGLLKDAWALAEELNVAAEGVVVESSYLSVVATTPL